jgi:hypothetical protein
MDRIASRKKEVPAAEISAEASTRAVLQKWTELVTGFRAQIAVLNRQDSALFEELSGTECRIANSNMSVAVVVSVDAVAQNIHYVYEPESDQTAVPEGGMLSIRVANNSAELFSADQHLNLDQACRLILEPVLFAEKPLPKTGT